MYIYIYIYIYIIIYFDNQLLYNVTATINYIFQFSKTNEYIFQLYIFFYIIFIIFCIFICMYVSLFIKI